MPHPCPLSPWSRLVLGLPLLPAQEGGAGKKYLCFLTINVQHSGESSKTAVNMGPHTVQKENPKCLEKQENHSLLSQTGFLSGAIAQVTAPTNNKWGGGGEGKLACHLQYLLHLLSVPLTPVSVNLL